MRLALVLVGGTVCLALSGYLYGVPAPVRRWALAKAGGGAFAVTAERLRLSGIGVTLVGARCYRKGVVGPPGLEADSLTVRFSLPQWCAGCDGVSAIDLVGVRVRPRQLRSRKAGPLHPGMRPMRARLRVRDGEVDGIRVVMGTARVEAADKGIDVTGFSATLAHGRYAGQVSGAVTVRPATGAVSGNLTVVLDPRLIRPLGVLYGPPYLVVLCDRFAFDGDEPRCSLSFDYRHEERRHALRLMGEFRMRDCSYRGVELLRCDGDIGIRMDADACEIAMHDLFVRRPEGDARGMVNIRPRQGVVTFDAVSGIDPVSMARMIGIGGPFLCRHFVFDGPVAVRGAGTVDYATWAATDFACEVQTARMSVGPVDIDNASCRIGMRGIANTIGDIRAAAYGGTITGDVTIACPRLRDTNAGVDFRGALAMQGMDFGVLMESLTKRPSLDYKGALSGEVRVAGAVTEAAPWETLVGEGRVRVQDGRVFLLPVFGGLSRLMARIIPGLDFVLRQSDARAEFTIDRGRIHSDHIVVDGDILSLSGHGDYTLPRDIDLDVQVRLLKEHTLVAKLLRFLTYPVSKLFEFRVRGVVTDPRWYPVNFSADLLERVGLRTSGESVPGDARDEDSGVGVP